MLGSPANLGKCYRESMCFIIYIYNIEYKYCIYSVYTVYKDYNYSIYIIYIYVSIYILYSICYMV